VAMISTLPSGRVPVNRIMRSTTEPKVWQNSSTLVGIRGKMYIMALKELPLSMSALATRRRIVKVSRLVVNKLKNDTPPLCGGGKGLEARGDSALAAAGAAAGA